MEKAVLGVTTQQCGAHVRGPSSPRHSHSKQPVRCQAAVASPSTIDLRKYEEDGFLCVPGHASKQQCAQLQQRMSELLDSFDPDSVRTIFTTKNQVTDNYFVDSANNISFFFEEKAFDEQGKLRQDKALSINKVGHALHDLDPVFRPFSRSEEVKSVLRSLGFKRPIPVQSMYIFKQPNIGGEVVPHQDSTFLWTDPKPTCVGLWWALEDCSKSNGCLWAQPGVHKQGVLRRFIRDENAKMIHDRPAPHYELDKFEPLECEAGSLVILHGENIHYSCENTSSVSRHSYSMHVVESVPGITWSPDNWLQRSPDFPFEPLYDDYQ